MLIYASDQSSTFENPCSIHTCPCIQIPCFMQASTTDRTKTSARKIEDIACDLFSYLHPELEIPDNLAKLTFGK